MLPLFDLLLFVSEVKVNPSLPLMALCMLQEYSGTDLTQIHSFTFFLYIDAGSPGLSYTIITDHENYNENVVWVFLFYLRQFINILSPMLQKRQLLLDFFSPHPDPVPQPVLPASHSLHENFSQGSAAVGMALGMVTGICTWQGQLRWCIPIVYGSLTGTSAPVERACCHVKSSRHNDRPCALIRLPVCKRSKQIVGNAKSYFAKLRIKTVI